MKCCCLAEFLSPCINCLTTYRLCFSFIFINITALREILMWTKHPIMEAHMLIKAFATLQCDVNSLQSNFVFLPQSRGHLGLNFAKHHYNSKLGTPEYRAVFYQAETLELPSSKYVDGALSTRLWWRALMKKYNVMASGQQCLWGVSSWLTAFLLYDLCTSSCNRHLPRSNNLPAEECGIVSTERCPWWQQI